ncbi:MAG TPA: response regulator [Xanthobacteraceae bacterium]|jgi:DNA-binding NtrC family response regulator
MVDNDAELAELAGTVLVVEDEVLIRLVIAQYLRDCGYRVIEAAHADEALLVLRKSEIEIDVVFTDVEMPGSMDGFALSQWVRSNRPGMDVILAGSVGRAVQAASDLCDDGNNVPKPYDAQNVHDRIRRLLASRRPAKRDLQSRLKSAILGGTVQ